ncbi:hypothetical protein GRAN_2894 [Granulicella sibirica]|uniref:Uncharacterized protein n=1 Tax=Granulicella sibirica TaxID=2479048 RepID=A0A4Q0SYX1_9BACT|nr:hypothetical protein GRAN_2894 [Granulicella sibirica]
MAHVDTVTTSPERVSQLPTTPSGAAQAAVDDATMSKSTKAMNRFLFMLFMTSV